MTMEIDSQAPGHPAPALVPMAASKLGRSPGKAHKSQKVAKVRSYISPAIKTPFEKRKEAEKKKQAVKDAEREMKEEVEEDKTRKREALKERRERAEEKKRLEEAKAKMSAKKLQRMRKVCTTVACSFIMCKILTIQRQGRSKKING